MSFIEILVIANSVVNIITCTLISYIFLLGAKNVHKKKKELLQKGGKR